jgi:transcriptional pleiotropic regulator of transition state genes
MKSTGIVRPVDMFGRIVLPKELRSTLNITEKDSLEIFVEENSIILKKYQPSCVFCGSMDRISKYKEHNVCHKCMERLAKRLEEESD